jgi:hypothetical protein
MIASQLPFATLSWGEPVSFHPLTQQTTFTTPSARTFQLSTSKEKGAFLDMGVGLVKEGPRYSQGLARWQFDPKFSGKPTDFFRAGALSMFGYSSIPGVNAPTEALRLNTSTSLGIGTWALNPYNISADMLPSKQGRGFDVSHAEAVSPFGISGFTGLSVGNNMYGLRQAYAPDLHNMSLAGGGKLLGNTELKYPTIITSPSTRYPSGQAAIDRFLAGLPGPIRAVDSAITGSLKGLDSGGKALEAAKTHRYVLPESWRATPADVKSPAHGTFIPAEQGVDVRSVEVKGETYKVERGTTNKGVPVIRTGADIYAIPAHIAGNREAEDAWIGRIIDRGQVSDAFRAQQAPWPLNMIRQGQ